MTFKTAKPDITEMLNDPGVWPRKAIVRHLEQTYEISSATAYRWVEKAEMGSSEKVKALKALRRLLKKKEELGDADGIVTVALAIGKLT
jgi:IS30 family transposase